MSLGFCHTSLACLFLSLFISNSLLVYTLAPLCSYLTPPGSFAPLQSADLQVKVQGQNKTTRATWTLSHRLVRFAAPDPLTQARSDTH